MLQRRGIPFAAGVLPENDLDYPVARALAAEVISEDPFLPVGEEALQRARMVIDKCERVICCTESFGPMNEANKALREYAAERGLLLEQPEEIRLLAQQGS